jgi:ribosomal protein S18 acetylase RimI-like enzyme
LDAVLELWRQADAEPTHTDDVDSLRKLLARDPTSLLVAVDGERLVGSVIAGWDGWRGSIYRLVVHPAQRRQGLGRTLLAAAERQLASAGAVRLQAIVVESDEEASAFWRASDWGHQVARVRFVKG